MLGLETALRLPMSFDPVRLQRDLKAIEAVKMQAHYGGYHDGKWSAIGLVSQGGRMDDLQMGNEPYQKTDLLKQCPYFNEVIDSFPCEKQRVRLMAIAPGGKIFEHYDLIETLDRGVVRLHIPVVTHPDVVFVIAKRRVVWKEGELWYGDFSFPHYVENPSQINRVHMVMDFKVDEFIASLFPKDYIEQKRWRQYDRLFHLNWHWYHKKLAERFPGLPCSDKLGVRKVGGSLG
jgi:hypothetical protein